MSLPDYSEYLKQPGMLAWIEQEWKANPHIHEEHARVVNEFIGKYYSENKDEKVLEIGCGTGQLAMKLRMDINYFGIDSNEKCIEVARNKDLPYGSYKAFAIEDIRTCENKNGYFDLVISFGFLKHFGLHEWFDIFKKVSSFGKYFIFDMPIGETKDDGTEFHHVWKSKDDLLIDITMAGLELIEIVNQDSVEPIFICKKK